MRFQSYFNTAIKIIQSYDGIVPLHHYLKQYFSQYKKHGSKDRKIISHACYNFFRLGKSFNGITIEEKLKTAIFICNSDAGGWDFLYDDEWLSNWDDSLTNRIRFIQKKYTSFSLNDVFPFVNELSESLDKPAYIQSFFIQPDVFIRMRPGYGKPVVSKLQDNQINFKLVEEACIALPSSVKIDTIIDLDKEALVQDQSSQRIKEFLTLIKSETPCRRNAVRQENPKPEIEAWDCCAGSGGKSILAYDVLEKINLTVSDVRASIIQNLKERFAKAGIKTYKSFVADITNSKFQSINSSFDLIICDAPCTGSGTWSRTPEQLYFFNQGKIDEYAYLQQKIVTNAISCLKPDGYFLYITCSVFKKENEDIIEFIKNLSIAELIKMDLLKGYHQRADTMFAALFRKTA